MLKQIDCVKFYSLFILLTIRHFADVRLDLQQQGGLPQQLCRDWEKPRRGQEASGGAQSVHRGLECEYLSIDSGIWRLENVIFKLIVSA